MVLSSGDFSFNCFGILLMISNCRIVVNNSGNIVSDLTTPLFNMTNGSSLTLENVRLEVIDSLQTTYQKIAICYDSEIIISGFEVTNIWLSGDSKSSLFYLQNVSANITDISFSGCEVTNLNFLTSLSSVTYVSNAFFSKNSLVNQNSIYLNSLLYLTGNTSISKLSFIENSVTDFFLLYADDDISATISDITCSNNTLAGISKIIELSNSEIFYFEMESGHFVFNSFVNSLIILVPSNISSSNVKVNRVKFYSNQGYVVLSMAEIDTVIMSDNEFRNNKATSIQIFNTQQGIVKNMSFIANEGVSDLPGIHIEQDEILGTVNLDSLSFIDNRFFTSDDKNSIGVSIRIRNSNCSTIQNCSFLRNLACFNLSASGDPGIVFIGINLTVIKCAFVGNKALSSTMALIFSGNSLCVHESLFKQNSQIDDSFSTITMPISAFYNFFNFSYNICEENFFSQGMITLSTLDSFSFFHSFMTFYRANLFDRNGQFYLDESANRTILIENCTIIDNLGNGYSTILYVYIYSKIILENITFSNCLAINNTSVSSPLAVVWIYSSNVYVSMIQTIYLDMTTIGFGGPLFNIFGLEDGFNMTLDRVVIIRSNTKQAGIFWVFQLNLNVSNCIFKDIFAETTASVFYLINSVTVYFTNSTIKNGSSLNNAGAIYANDNSVLVMRNITISDCSSVKDIILVQTFAQIILINVTIANFTNPLVANIFTISNTGDLIHEAESLTMRNITSKLFYIQKAGFVFRKLQIMNTSDAIFFIKFALYVDVSDSSFEDNICNNYDQFCILYGSSSFRISINSTVILNTTNLARKSLFLIETNSKFLSRNLSFSAEESMMNSGLLQASSSDIALELIFLMTSNFYLVSASSCFTLNFSQINSEFASFSPSFAQPLFYITSSLHITIESSKFLNFNVSGSFLIWITNSPLIFIRNNSFSNIFSLNKGAVIKIESSYGSISNNFFFKNSAERASCIWFYTPLPFVISESTSLLISNNVFDSNEAVYNGAAIFFEFCPPILRNNTFNSNNGSYAPDSSSFPFRLDFTNNISNNLNPVAYIAREHSGRQITQDISISAYDAYDNLITEDLKAQMNVEIDPSVLKLLKIQSEASFLNVLRLLANYTDNPENYEKFFPIYKIEGRTSVFQESDFNYLFSGLLLTSTPKYFNFLSFDSSFMQKIDRVTFLNITNITQDISEFRSNEFIESETAAYKLFLPINVSECMLGEIYDSEKNTCENCSSGTYSLNPLDPVCHSCPEEAVCSGGSDFSLKPGYWRSNAETKIYLCDRMLESCLGGFYSNCSGGYEGPLCDECSKSKDGGLRQRKFSGRCEDCPVFGVSVFLSVLFFLGLMTITVILNCYLLGNSLKMYQKAALRIFINFFHFAIILETYNIALPSYIPLSVYLFSNFSRLGDFWFSLSCLLSESGSHLEGILIFIFLLSFTLFLWIYGKFLEIKDKNKKKSFQRAEIFLYLVLPSSVDYFYSMITCIDIDGVLYRVSNKKDVCWEKEYTLWFSLFYLPLLFCLTILIPYLVFRFNNQRIGKLFKIGVDLALKYGKSLRSASIRKNLELTMAKPPEKSTKPKDNGKSQSHFHKPTVTEEPLKLAMEPGKRLSSEDVSVGKTPKMPEINSFLLIGYRTNSMVWECLNYLIKLTLILINRSQFPNDLKLVTLLFIFIFVLAFEMSVPFFSLPYLNFLSFTSKLLIVVTLYGLIWFLSDEEVEEQEEWKKMLFALWLIVYAIYIFGMVWTIFVKEEIKEKVKNCLKGIRIKNLKKDNEIKIREGL